MSKDARIFNTFPQIAELSDDGVFLVGELVNGVVRFRQFTKAGFIAQFISSSNPTELSQLSDVTIVNPKDGQILTFDSASLKWINSNNYKEHTRAEMLAILNDSQAIPGQLYKITDTSAIGDIVFQFACNEYELSVQGFNSTKSFCYYDIYNDVFELGLVGNYVIDYEPTIGLTYKRGRVFYDGNNECLAYYDNINGTSVQVGQENILRARNASGSTIANGSVVYVSGATGTNPRISLAQANAESTSRVIGVATHDIANNSVGKVCTFGIVNDINTNAFNEGDILYLSSSVAGGLTSTRPLSPNQAISVATVLFKHGINGKILVHPSNYGIGFGTANQVLKMNAGATGLEFADLSLATLDDYETGTWTPSLNFSNVTTGIVYSTRIGTYTKIGDVITLTCSIVLSSKGTGAGGVGQARLTGIPFLINLQDSSFNLMFYSNINHSITNYVGALYGGYANEYILFGTAGFGYTEVLNYSNFTDTSEFKFNLTFKIR